MADYLNSVEIDKKEKLLQKVLINNKLVTDEQIKESIEMARVKRLFFGQVLVEKKYIDEKTLGEILEFNIGIPFVNLNEYPIDYEVSKYLSEKIIREYKILPIKKENNMLYVAMANPLDVLVIDKVRLMTGFEVIPLLAIERDLDAILKHSFAGKSIVDELIEDVEFVKEDDTEVVSEIELKNMVNETPVIKLVNSVITGAISDRASDVHLEPVPNGLKVRYRIDGILYDRNLIPLSVKDAVISRIKVMSGIDIAERRRPQDGHMSIKVQDKYFDIRIGTFLTVYGEQVTMRLLDKTRTLLGLSELGMNVSQENLMRDILKIPYGMFLSSAPTGSGKTTTLYAALDTVKSTTKKIITLEDPVEYQLSGITQAQLNVKAGISFENGLRSILRHDPDVILVGEIRDRETAEIAIQASLTGRFIFSTIHAKDAPSSIIRLLNLDIEPFLVASSMIGVISQRLVRKICNSCRFSYKPNEDEIKWLSYGKNRIDGTKFSKGRGCTLCNNTGYYERIGIFEIMRMSQKIKELIIAREPSDIVMQEAINSGMQTLYESSLEKVRDGITTVDEAIRVVTSPEAE